jgi:hypothetical protein
LTEHLVKKQMLHFTLSIVHCSPGIVHCCSVLCIVTSVLCIVAQYCALLHKVTSVTFVWYILLFEVGWTIQTLESLHGGTMHNTEGEVWVDLCFQKLKQLSFRYTSLYLEDFFQNNYPRVQCSIILG